MFKKIYQFLKPILKGVVDATPLGGLKTVIKNYRDKTNLEANKTYVFTFFLTLVCLALFAFGKLDFEMLLELIKKLN